MVVTTQLADFESLSVPPKPKATLYETGRFWLTAIERFVLTQAEKFFLIETDGNGLTAYRAPGGTTCLFPLPTLVRFVVRHGRLLVVRRGNGPKVAP